MINVDTTEKQMNRKKVRMRNSYADLWALFLVILYVLGCFYFFNTFNPFTSTWGYIRIASKEETKIKLDSNTTMIRKDKREGYMISLVYDLEKSNFTVVEQQTHLLTVEKDGIKYDYNFVEKSLLGNDYTLVIREEAE